MSLEISKKSINSLFKYPSGVQYSVNVNDKDISFFFFGCWNKDISKTQEIINATNIAGVSFGIVNGDNFYPTVIREPDGSKTKIFNQDNVTKGFNVLKTSNNYIFFSLGNHEVDDTTSCRTLMSEIETCSEDTSKLLMPTNFYSILVRNNKSHHLKIVIIDTNLFETNFCYSDASSKEQKEKMLSWLILCLNETKEIPLLIVGHYPLFYHKKGSFFINVTMQEVFDILIEASDRKIYYLASDVHNHQHIEHKHITQYIVGTGGADLDDIDDSAITIHYDDFGGVYNLINAKQCYGHSVISYNGERISHVFKCLE